MSGRYRLYRAARQTAREWGWKLVSTAAAVHRNVFPPSLATPCNHHASTLLRRTGVSCNYHILLYCTVYIYTYLPIYIWNDNWITGIYQTYSSDYSFTATRYYTSYIHRRVYFCISVMWSRARLYIYIHVPILCIWVRRYNCVRAEHKQRLLLLLRCVWGGFKNGWEEMMYIVVY